MDFKNNSLLSEKDILILKKLIEDGRKSSSQISKEIDLGREIVNYRIKRLVKENLIVRFVPKINEKISGYREYIILIKLKIEDELSKDKFIKENIGNKYLIWTIKSGEGWDLIIRLYAKDIVEFREKLKEILEKFQESIARYYTIMTLDEIKQNEKEILFENLFENEIVKKDFKVIKKENDLIQLDDKDRKIITLLENDGRVQYSEIAKELEVSSDTIKYRIEKMKNEGLIENFEPVINFSKLGFLQSVCVVSFDYLDENKKKEFESFLNKNSNITKAIKSFNCDEYFIILVFKTKNDEKNFKKDIEENFKFKNIDYFEIK